MSSSDVSKEGVYTFKVVGSIGTYATNTTTFTLDVQSGCDTIVITTTDVTVPIYY